MSVQLLRTVDSGEAHLPMLVFLHGWPDSAALWKAQVAYFSGRFRTVVVEFPAFGSDRASAGADFPVLAERLAATLGALATPRPPHVVVVGHDWGAYLAYHFERRHPEWVDGLVTLDVGAHVQPTGIAHLAFLVSYQWWLVAAWLVGHVVPPVGTAMSRLFARYAQAPEAGRTTWKMNYWYAYFWRARFRKRYGDRILRKYRPSKPILYCYGSAKRFHFHSKRWEKIVAECADSAVVPIESDHWFLLRRPEETNAAIDRWLARWLGG